MPLLDWLEVRQAPRCRRRAPGSPTTSTGLILLDLPDFDSTKAANREIVQRMVGLVDVLVWVLDPQKYADAAVHNDFLAPLSSHGAVTMVVLNQIDRLPGARRRGRCWSRSQAILARDGLGKVQVLGGFRRAGDGGGQGAGRDPPGGDAAAGDVTATCRGCHAGRRPAGRGVRPAADGGRPRAAATAAGATAASKARLAGELAVAANVPLVVDAVARSYRLEATRRTGWPVTRWLVRFRPDPLRRLNLRREGAKPS